MVHITAGQLVSWDSELEHSFEADNPSDLRAMIGPLAMHAGALHFCIPAGADWEDDPVSISVARGMGRGWSAEDEVKIQEAAAGIGPYANNSPDVQERLQAKGIEKVREEIRLKVEAEAARRAGTPMVIVTVQIIDEIVHCTTMDGEAVATLEASSDKVLLGDVRVAAAASRKDTGPLMLITVDGVVLDGPDDQALKDALVQEVLEGGAD